MADSQLPTPSLLRQLLSYEPETGRLAWLPRTSDHFRDGGHSAAHRAANWNARYAGTDALTALSTHGYHRGNIFGRSHSAHRVAWAIHYGEWPNGEIDHINHDICDNRICNLRIVDRTENMRNASFRKDNKSGATGVWYRKDTGKWAARLGSGRSARNLGSFATFDEAHRARKLAALQVGYHANHGK
jgi:hypothetical protein